jgi:hypothetical protein
MRMPLAGIAAALLLLLLLSAPAPAEAADGVVVDGTAVSAEKSDAGDITADVVLINTGAAVTLAASVDLSESCSVELPPVRVPARQSTTVTLELDPGCFEGREKVRVDLDGAAGALPKLMVGSPEEATSDWAPMRDAALVALAVAAVVLLMSCLFQWRVDGRQKEPTDATLEDRRIRDAQAGMVVDPLLEEIEGGGPHWTGSPPPPPRFGWSAEISGLEAGWSFQDSWVSNLSVLTTAFIALASSTDALTALLGEEPKDALGVMTVAGLLSAVVIAGASAVVRLTGPSTSTVTVLGLVLSTSLVVFASTFQVFTVGLATTKLLDGRTAEATVALTLGVGLALLAYALKAMEEAIGRGPADNLPTVPEDAVDEWRAGSAWEKELVRQRVRDRFGDRIAAPSAAPDSRSAGPRAERADGVVVEHRRSPSTAPQRRGSLL